MSEKPIKKKIEIVPMGSYVDLDQEGYIVNPTSYDKIQPHWRPLIRDTVEYYQHLLNDGLDSVFVRGSVAKGEAVDGVSDLDTFAYATKRTTNEYLGMQQFQEEVANKFAFCKGVEIGVYDVGECDSNASGNIQALQVYGDPIDQPKLRPGRDMVRNTPGIFNRIANNELKLETLETDPNPERVMLACVWLMKELLRIGVELTYERSGRFTRDLYLCYKDFSEFYPDYSDQMLHILDLALNPSDSIPDIRYARDSVLGLLQSEAVRMGLAKPQLHR